MSITTKEAIALLTNTDSGNRDESILWLVQEHECTLNMANNAWKTYAKEAGISKAVVSHKKEALAHLEYEWAGISPISAGMVSDMVIDLVDKFGVAESTARDYIRDYCKTTGSVLETADPRMAIFDWFKDNEEDLKLGRLDKDDYLEFAESIGRSRSNANEYWKGFELHLYLAQ